MKRKRGHKKGKSKGAKAARVSEEASQPIPSQNTENDSADDEVVHEEPESGKAATTPSSSGTEQPSNVASTNPDEMTEKTNSKPIGRVKVKLKTSKVSDSQHNSSDAPAQSDTDKSIQKIEMEKEVIDVDKKDDSIDSVLEIKAGSSENSSKKAASIKIKTPKTVASLSGQTSNAVGGEVESVKQKEPKEPVRNTQYNKQELDSALTVIRKVMKMDAAEPFNVPVDPIALGIPDYFDVIDTPMDFGTICANLEKGGKYKNSEDVFYDVQYIWGNCYKYNNKGDYILDLMRRVKKNFMKYWTAAGLYSGSDNNQGENASGKRPKGKKRHGFRRHKSDCLCAICVLKRKRKEREERERIARGQTTEEPKQEDPSNLGSPYGEGSSSNSDDSEDNDEDADTEEKREEVKSQPSQQQQQQHSPRNQKNDDEVGKDSMDVEMETRRTDEIPTETPDNKAQHVDSLGVETANGMQMKGAESSGVQESSQKEIASEHLDENAALQQQKMKESRERKQRAQLYESLYSENPTLLSLCASLFTEDPNSVWSGPHSFVPQRRRPAQGSSLLAAIESFMK